MAFFVLEVYSVSVWNAILLGIIQGVSEFLPISSSGHLSVLQNVFHMQTAEEGHLFFDVLLHFGTLIAIIAAYWTDVVAIVRDTGSFIRASTGRGEAQQGQSYSGGRMLLMIIFATLPLFVILPFNDRIETLYYKTGFIGAAFLLTGCMLYVSDKMPQGRKTEKSMTVKDALLIGLCQAVATIPGISRSGSTITAGIATGHDREFAAKFSLLMSVPAVFGANLLSLIKALKEGNFGGNMGAYLVGMVFSAVVGYFSIILLRRIIRRGKFGKFAYYLWGVGILTLILSLFT